MVTENKYWPTGDIIRVCGIFAVSVIHLVQVPLRSSLSLNFNWWSLNVLHSFSIWVVPGFIMLSSALLLSPQRLDEPALEFYQKRMLKIAIPFVFWAIVYLCFHYWHNRQSLDYLFGEFLHGWISWHLYFLFVLMGLYAVTPLIRLWLKKVSPRQELITIILTLVILASFDAISHTIGFWRWNLLTRWIPYLGYYLMGRYIIYRADDRRVLFLVLSVVGVSVNAIAKFLEIKLASQPVLFFYSSEYASILIVPLAIGIFGTFVSLTKIKIGIQLILIRQISPNSLEN
jgi:surface polysaccharide O-acyltransferase-like enzyme